MDQARLIIREDAATEVSRGWIRALEVEIGCCGTQGRKELCLGRVGT